MRRANVLLVVASVALTILIAEIGLRIANVTYPEFNRLDPLLGWSARPEVAGIYAVEDRTWISINEEGFRDIHHQQEKPAGTLRVAVLGDSFAEGREVPLDKVFWKVMEGDLSRCLQTKGLKAEVLGFAINGYGTAQQVLVLESRVAKYVPDVVLLTVFTGNDISNNSHEIDGHPDRPYFRLVGGQLHLENGHLRTTAFRMKRLWSDIKHGLFNTLRTTQVVRQAYASFKARLKYRDLDITEQLMAGLSGKVYRPPQDDTWRNAWALTEALMERAAISARAQGAQFALATLSNPIQVTPNIDARAVAIRDLGVSDLLYPDRRLAKFGRRSGIPVITLAERLAAQAVSSGVSLHGRKSFAGGHWNETGHRAAGKILASELCDLLQ